MYNRILTLSAINALSIVLSIANTILVSIFFGTSREIEVWFSCLIIVQVIVKFSQSGELSEVLLPIYKSYKSKNQYEDAYRVTSAIINCFVIFLILVILLTSLLGSLIIKATIPGFDFVDQNLGHKLFMFISPVIIFIFISGQFQTLLNADNIIGKPEKITLISRILNISTILLGYDYFGIWIMPIALYVSTVFKTIFFISYYIKNGGIYFFTLKSRNESIYKQIKKLYPTIPYIVSTQIWTITFNSGISYLPQGYYAIFKYAQTFISKLNHVLIRPVSIIFFTNFADIYFSGEKRFNSLVKMITQNFMFMFSTALIIVQLSLDYLLVLFLENEKFLFKELIILSETVKILFFFPIFNCLYVLKRKILVTINKFEKTYLSLSCAQVLTALGSFILIKNFGYYGAIASIYLNVMLLLFFSFIVLFKADKKLVFFYEKKYLVKTFLSCFIIVMLGKFLLNFFNMAISIEEVNMLKALSLVSIYCLVMFFINLKIIKLKPTNF